MKLCNLLGFCVAMCCISCRRFTKPNFIIWWRYDIKTSEIINFIWQLFSPARLNSQHRGQIVSDGRDDSMGRGNSADRATVGWTGIRRSFGVVLLVLGVNCGALKFLEIIFEILAVPIFFLSNHSRESELWALRSAPGVLQHWAR